MGLNPARPVLVRLATGQPLSLSRNRLVTPVIQGPGHSPDEAGTVLGELAGGCQRRRHQRRRRPAPDELGMGPELVLLRGDMAVPAPKPLMPR